ncbi:unnamed protein product [Rhizoctonia solani]|nr:unnamed protein product [Rhizoctonia solani]
MTVEAESDDTERYIREEPPLRVEAQTTPQSQLTYYKEAIRVLPRYNAETRDEQEWIEDWELNTVFSQLPEGCTLTSVLDCCASGRMINNTIKAGGYGFRGGSNEPTKRSMSSVPAAAEGSLVEISMPEKLPEVEAAMDRITANAYTWAACHQRQQAAPHPHSTGSGHFTWVFTQELDLAPREMSIEELFNKVSERMQREALPGNNQYAQLRVSMAERTHWQVKLRDMMERPVSVI